MTTSLAPGADEDHLDAFPWLLWSKEEQKSSNFLIFQCLFINKQGTFHFDYS